eukprot:7388109-Prymnesium_polylepis.1
MYELVFKMTSPVKAVSSSPPTCSSAITRLEMPDSTSAALVHEVQSTSRTFANAEPVPSTTPSTVGGVGSYVVATEQARTDASPARLYEVMQLWYDRPGTATK